jgi:anti-sigma B factor antagonist
MEIQIRERGDVAIAGLTGRLAAGVGDQQLRGVIDELLASERRNILLDFSQVSSIDSSGVGELVAGLRVARELGGQIKILQVPERVEHVLRLGQMLPLFEIFEDEASAIESFRGAAEG